VPIRQCAHRAGLIPESRPVFTNNSGNPVGLTVGMTPRSTQALPNKSPNSRQSRLIGKFKPRWTKFPKTPFRGISNRFRETDFSVPIQRMSALAIMRSLGTKRREVQLTEGSAVSPYQSKLPSFARAPGVTLGLSSSPSVQLFSAARHVSHSRLSSGRTSPQP
jgi:hypothetical protein